MEILAVLFVSFIFMSIGILRIFFRNFGIISFFERDIFKPLPMRFRRIRYRNVESDTGYPKGKTSAKVIYCLDEKKNERSFFVQAPKSFISHYHEIGHPIIDGEVRVWVEGFDE